MHHAGKIRSSERMIETKISKLSNQNSEKKKVSEMQQLKNDRILMAVSENVDNSKLIENLRKVGENLNLELQSSKKNLGIPNDVQLKDQKTSADNNNNNFDLCSALQGQSLHERSKFSENALDPAEKSEIESNTNKTIVKADKIGKNENIYPLDFSISKKTKPQCNNSNNNGIGRSSRVRNNNTLKSLLDTLETRSRETEFKLINSEHLLEREFLIEKYKKIVKNSNLELQNSSKKIVCTPNDVQLKDQKTSTDNNHNNFNLYSASQGESLRDGLKIFENALDPVENTQKSEIRSSTNVNVIKAEEFGENENIYPLDFSISKKTKLQCHNSNNNGTGRSSRVTLKSILETSETRNSENECRLLNSESNLLEREERISPVLEIDTQKYSENEYVEIVETDDKLVSSPKLDVKSYSIPGTFWNSPKDLNKYCSENNFIPGATLPNDLLIRSLQLSYLQYQFRKGLISCAPNPHINFPIFPPPPCLFYSSPLPPTNLFQFPFPLHGSGCSDNEPPMSPSITSESCSSLNSSKCNTSSSVLSQDSDEDYSNAGRVDEQVISGPPIDTTFVNVMSNVNRNFSSSDTDASTEIISQNKNLLLNNKEETFLNLRQRRNAQATSIHTKLKNIKKATANENSSHKMGVKIRPDIEIYETDSTFRQCSSEDTAQKRIRRKNNKRERERVRDIIKAYDDLNRVLPPMCESHKITKLAILKNAISYINFLDDLKKNQIESTEKL